MISHHLALETFLVSGFFGDFSWGQLPQTIHTPAQGDRITQDSWSTAPRQLNSCEWTYNRTRLVPIVQWVENRHFSRESVVVTAVTTNRSQRYIVYFIHLHSCQCHFRASNDDELSGRFSRIKNFLWVKSSFSTANDLSSQLQSLWTQPVTNTCIIAHQRTHLVDLS